LTKYDLVTEAVWLACAIDGEGSVTIYSTENGHSQQITVANTKSEFLDRAYSILSKLGAQHIIRYETCVVINYREDLLVVLPQILPHLVIESKIQAAKAIMAHCKDSLQKESQKINEYKELFDAITKHPNITIPELKQELIWLTRNRLYKLSNLEQKGYVRGVVNLESLRHTQWIITGKEFDEIDFLNRKRVRKVEI